jgi:hypothetical protein
MTYAEAPEGAELALGAKRGLPCRATNAAGVARRAYDLLSQRVRLQRRGLDEAHVHVELLERGAQVVRSERARLRLEAVVVREHGL